MTSIIASYQNVDNLSDMVKFNKPWIDHPVFQNTKSENALQFLPKILFLIQEII